MTTADAPVSTIVYPESDGKRMAENTEQYAWLVLIKENLEILFADDPQVFVAGDLLWYPVEGKPRICKAPDVFVVLGRPKGRRGSYRQWEEDNIAPQVVFEILSPANTADEMLEKFNFYEQYGVQEYYVYDPDTDELSGWQRTTDEGLTTIPHMDGWRSPALGIRFDLSGSKLAITTPTGQPFLSSVERFALFEQERSRAEQERSRAEQERSRAEHAEARLAALTARLQQLGINPDDPDTRALPDQSAP